MRFIDKTGKEPSYLLTHRKQNKLNNYKTFSHAGLGNITIAENEKHYGLRKDLVYAQGHLCCFCMCAIPQYPYTNNDMKIAHWYPQDGKLTKDDQKDISYSNLFAACRGGDKRPEVKSVRQGYTCDKQQANNFLVVNPSKQKHIDLLKYEGEGEIFCTIIEGKDKKERNLNLKNQYKDLLKRKKEVGEERLNEEKLTEEELKIAIQYDIEFNLNLNETTLKMTRSAIFKRYSEKLKTELSRQKAGKFMDRTKKNEYLQSEVKKYLDPVSLNKFAEYSMVYVFCAKEKIR